MIKVYQWYLEHYDELQDEPTFTLSEVLDALTEIRKTVPWDQELVWEDLYLKFLSKLEGAE